METDTITLSPIGIVKSEIKDGKDMPLGGIKAQIEVLPQYIEALERIDESSHLWILSWFHKAARDVMKVVPRKANPEAGEFGVFAVRTPVRPNPIALTLVKLERVQGNILYVTGLDAIDGTPVLDIKPYFKNDIV
ncbi:MAG: tRNA (N6-threonylcarbamoyladenosine(37)-N6)-methyltransferase TrmO [Bacillota bacterium]|nr:tRNA (N6-threonylcarbamoyladenosine(37)-N6)-methyltransferase TrmO [Bacillota bacterium]